MNFRDTLLERVHEGYRVAFGEEPDAIYAAPGRVNLIGEHLDYNDGLVLPCAIDRHTMVAIGKGRGSQLEAIALDLDGARDAIDLAASIEPGKREWSNHVRGVAHFLQSRGVSLAGARLVIAGNVPRGAGLSSSASLGVALGLALSSEAGEQQPPEALAKIAQEAENHFVGTQCGIMDQMASACSREGHALLLDCRDMSYRHVPIAESLSLVIIDSGQRRELANSAFNTRRAECEKAAAYFEVASLRDVSMETLKSARDKLDEVIFNRAHHVISEIGRVEPAAAAIALGDVKALSNLMRESHVSLDQGFEVTTPNLNQLQSAIDHVLSRGRVGPHGGVRMTGGGFGGCLVALAENAWAESVVKAVEHTFGPDARAETCITAKAEVFEIGGGAQRLA